MAELTYSGFDNRHVAIARASIPAGAILKADVLMLLEELRRLCKKYGANFGLVWSQVWHETGGFDEPESEWKRRKNPGGLKSESGDTFMKYYNGVDAARAMMNHVLAYTTTETPYDNLDPRGLQAVRIALTTPLAERSLLATVAKSWAEDPGYATKVQNIYTRLFLMDGVLMPVLIVAGHRNLSGGNPAEADKTDELARAYLTALRAVGIRAEWWQQIDRDNDPDDSLDYLAGVAIGCRDWLKRQPDGGIMLDLHFEGGGAPGIFCVYPDWSGDFNPTDNHWAGVIASRIAGEVGLSTRTSGVTSPGAMSEQETGVGGQGFRLGMFNLTSSERADCIRLVIEHGSLDKSPDRDVINRLGIVDYATRCANAAARAIRELQV